jgi:hypothetical protein
MDALTALVPRDIPTALQLAGMLAKSQLLPDHFRGKESDVFLAIALGIELGLPPVTSLNSVFVIKGKPGLYADAKAAICLASPLCEYFSPIEMTAMQATWETKRRGAPAPVRVTVTYEQAVKAKWTVNDKYNTEPEVMLSARAKGRLANLVYPDILRGIATVEEMWDEPDTVNTMTPVAPIDVVSREVPPTPVEILRAITESRSEEELAAIAPRVAALKSTDVPDVQIRELRVAYAAQQKRLRGAGKGDGTDSK